MSHPTPSSEVIYSGSNDDHPPGPRQGRSTQGTRTLAVCPCPECSFAFSAQVYLHKHLKRTHHDIYWQMVRNGEIDNTAHAPDGQPMGSNGSVTDQILGDTDHHQTSSGAILHVCNQCGKTFSRLNHFTIHQRIHAGERPFRCSQCEQSFSALGHLKAHKQTHRERGESYASQVFSCTRCPYAFSSQVYLYRHLKSSHSDIYWQMVRSGELDSVLCLQTPSSSVATSMQTQGYPADQAISYGLAPNQRFSVTLGLTQPEEVPPRRLKPYMCVECDVSFSNVFDLKAHRREHH